MDVVEHTVGTGSGDNSAGSNAEAAFFGGESQMPMRQRVDAFDWSTTPLGPRSQWPMELALIVRQIMDSHFPKLIVWGPEGTSIYNDAYRPMLGDKPDALGQSLKETWSEIWDDIGPIAARAYRGESTYMENMPLTIERGVSPEKAWFTFCYSPLRLSDGTVAGMLNTVIETTETMRAQEDLQFLSRELGHRLKNTLTLVQAIANQSLREFDGTGSMQSFRDRLTALGFAHDVLLRQNWDGASLREVVTESLRAHDAPARLVIGGPDLHISSRATVTLAMILNELATNAVKYGALSTGDGRVELSWSIDGDDLTLAWREIGGPAVEVPARAGLGTRLIDRAFGAGTQVTREYHADGLRLSITSPLHLITE